VWTDRQTDMGRLVIAAFRRSFTNAPKIENEGPKLEASIGQVRHLQTIHNADCSAKGPPVRLQFRGKQVGHILPCPTGVRYSQEAQKGAAWTRFRRS